LRKLRLVAAGALTIAAVTAGITVASADSSPSAPTTTPIRHLVVIFDENESFDHYFGTYPHALNPPGEPAFVPAPDTPSVNGLGDPTSDSLLTSNPNAFNPQRLDRPEEITCDQSHSYGSEQKAFDGGLMDKFVEFTQGSSAALPCQPGIVMDYYDGNTVTGLWNYAQHFSMSDNSFSTGFGPSTPGALNLVSGNTSGAGTTDPAAPLTTVTSDPDPSSTLDDCAKASANTIMTGKNIGDLLGDKVTIANPLVAGRGLTWGWFEGGFRPTAVDAVTGKATCGGIKKNIANFPLGEYVPHHNPFAYYAATANQHHLPPSSPDKIGAQDQANHQYDLQDFDTALENGNLPDVSFLKAAAAEDGHPGSSDPLDEQHFIVRTINALQQSPDWDSTAVVIAYDDSDGWYDHVMSPIRNPSASPGDALNGPGVCGNVKDTTAPQGRCGYGPRQPLLVISPWARRNFVDHSITDQTSILRFIEDNWQLGRLGGGSMDAKAGSLGNMFDFDPGHARAPKVFLDPESGLVLDGPVDSGPPSGVTPDGQDVSGGGTGTTGGGGSGGGQTTTVTVPGVSGGNGGPVAQPAVQGPGGGTPAVVPPKGPVKKARIALACKATQHGRRLAIACGVSGADAAKGTTSLRFRLTQGSKQFATARAVVRGKRATVVLTAKRPLKHGSYRLRIAIAHSNGSTGAVSKVIRLR
jgi:phospholipase C